MPSNSPTDPSPARHRTLARRVAAVCLFITLCGLTAIPAIFFVEKYRGRAAWRAYETDARARGVKLAYIDYLPPEVPDAENFAAIPIFEAVFAAEAKGEQAPDPFKLPVARDVEKPPKLSDPIKQTRIDLAAWQKFFVETGALPAAGESAARDVLLALERYAEPLAQLDAASARPHCRFPVRYEKGFAAALPHLGLFQSAGKLYALRIASHLALGDSPAAGDAFQAGLRVVTATHDEPTLIVGLVRISVCAVLENALWDGLAGRQWAEPELVRIEADLARLDWLRDYLFAMGSERGGFNYMVDQIIQRPGMLAEMQAMIQAPPSPAFLTNWSYGLYPTGWHYQSKVRANRFFDETAARLDPTQRRFYPDRAVPSSPTHVTGLTTRIRLMLFAVAAPVYETVEKRFLQMSATTDQARLACALERHRLARSSTPTELAALVPEFLPKLPHEAINGQPYRYRRGDDNSWVLYSIGADLRDDGGALDPSLSSSKQKDWVWRYPDPVGGRTGADEEAAQPRSIARR